MKRKFKVNEIRVQKKYIHNFVKINTFLAKRRALISLFVLKTKLLTSTHIRTSNEIAHNANVFI